MNFGGELAVVAWETRRLLGRLASTSLDLPRGFYHSVARVWIGSQGILWSFYCNYIVFGRNSEGLTAGHVG